MAHPLLRRLPNALAVLRVLLVPVWGVLAELSRAAVLEGRDDPWRAACLITWLVIGASDVLDGWLARRLDATSQLGAHLDAVADKLAQVGLVTFFTFRGAPAFAPLPLWFWAVLVLRDVVLGSCWMALRRRHGTVHVVHHAHGRLVSLGMFLLLAWICAGGEAYVIATAALLAVAAGASTLSYVGDGVAQWRRAQA